MSEVIQNECLIEQAARWVVCLSAGDVSAEQRTAFESWLAQDPRHWEVYEQAERFCQSLPLPPKPPLAPTRCHTHFFVKVLLGVTLVAGAAYLFPLTEWLAWIARRP
jgi:transmembrane sensor